MNDMVCVVEEDIDLANLTEEIIAAHERSGRRGGTVSHIAENKFKLFDADLLKGNLTISTYDAQRKIMAQANPDTLRHFVRYYCNAVSKLRGAALTVKL